MFVFLDKLYDQGYIKSWFTWIEWLTLTAAIYLGAKAWDSSLLYIIGAISSVFVWWSACRVIILQISSYFNLKDINQTLKVAIAAIIGGSIPALILIAVVNLMTGFLMAT